MKIRNNTFIFLRSEKTAMKGLILASIILAFIAVLPSKYVPAYAQSPDWRLTVNAVDVPFGDTDVTIRIKSPFGAD